ncbi:type II toxin-antitoxin system PemK/MazF family toxin, partial [Enterococcus faecalis]|nr:type II toxin-antitoxin system PemK/MazF family toxin [Enterococcus faecalis]
VFLETAHEKLIDELLLKVRTVFQKVNKTNKF